MSCKLTWEPVGVYWKYYGKVTDMEVFKETMKAYGDSRFDELKYKLVDFLDVESIEISEDEVNVIATQHKNAERYNGYIKNAIIVRDKFSDMGKLARHFAAHFNDSPWDVRVFDDLDAANDWLDRKPPFKKDLS